MQRKTRMNENENWQCSVKETTTRPMQKTADANNGSSKQRENPASGGGLKLASEQNMY